MSVACRELSRKNATLAIPALSEAVAETITVPDTVAPEAGELMEITGGILSALLTVSDTPALVVVCPVELLATADREWLPLESVVVLSEMLNGATVTAAPELLPSTLNCTLVVLAETLVETVMVPETVAPDSGDVIEIDGATELLTVTMTAALVAVCADELEATAVSE